MWDPNVRESIGIPVEFFLRRIGSFNPFILLIALFEVVGLPKYIAYFSFWSVYYWVGMIGFYLLARRTFQDKSAAFVAYLLLMFSALGVRVFDSYFLLTVIPMIWFFYFFISLALASEDELQKQGRTYLLGMTFTLMILMTTYIPFFFLLIFVVFIFCAGIIYCRNVIPVLKRIFRFLIRNKLFTAFCAFALIVSCIPGFLMLKQTRAGLMVLPQRQAAEEYSTETISKEVNTFEVGFRTTTSWGIEEDLMYSSVFTDLRKFKFAVMYVPVFAFLLLGLGVIVPVNRRLLLLALWATVIFILCSPNAKVYHYLYEHVFFFRYFRNLHFFLWFILLPLFVLFVAELFRWLWNMDVPSRRQKAVLAWTALVHAAALGLLIWQGDAVVSSFVAVIFSAGLWFGRFIKGGGVPGWLVCGLFFAVVVQPLEVLQYVPRNSSRYVENTQWYKTGFQSFLPQLDLLPESRVGPQGEFLEEDLPYDPYPAEAPETYISVKWYAFLISYFDYETVLRHVTPRLLAYDRTEYLDEQAMDIKRVDGTLYSHLNTAFVGDAAAVRPSPAREALPPYADIITINDPKVEVTAFDNNHLKFKTRYETDKFIVYADTYYPQWFVFIDGKEVPVYRANIAFKGVWVPAGEHEVYFRFGPPFQYVLNHGLLALFYGVFALLVFWAVKWRVRL